MAARSPAAALVAWPVTASFVDFFNREWLRGPGLELSDYRLRAYEQAVTRLVRFCGGKSPTLGQVTAELLGKLAIACGVDKRGRKWRDDVRCCLTRIMRAWNPGFGRAVVAPPAAGSVLQEFERRYVPERLVGAAPSTFKEYRTALYALRAYLGADLLLDQLADGDAILAGFFGHCLEQGKPATTVNKYRAHLLPIIRFAAEQGRTTYWPRVRKLREVRNPPDAWSIDEMSQLVRAAATFRAGRQYGAIDCGRWWTALLLVGYLTGLRRRSLLAIRMRDLDLTKGSLFVPGEAMKNRHGQQFTLSREAVRAIKLIARPPRELLFECPYRVNAITKHFAVLVRAAGVAPGRHRRLNYFHKLRRTCCTWVMVHSSLAVASHLMGHSGEYVTRFYLDPSRAKSHDTAAILPKLAVG